MIPFALIAFACAAFLAFMPKGDGGVAVGLVVVGVVALAYRLIPRE